MRIQQIITFFLFFLILSVTAAGQGRSFYVDPAKGKDFYEGSLEEPFQTLDKALQTVSSRVAAGKYSDKIYLREGIYRKESAQTLYHLNLKGTPDDFSLISAMPCEPGKPGAVQRKSGQWYERVVFDDAQQIRTKWEKDDAHPGVWKTNPGYTPLEWIHQNLWCWRGKQPAYPLSKEDSTPNTTSFTIGPYMLMQDNKPFIWKDSPELLTSPGHHTYDHATGLLYLFPFQGKDPNTCKIESWYGDPEDYDEGILYLDGEGRALFNGNMQYAGIVGCEFRMFVRMFEFQRRGYKREEDREIQRHVRIEDNVFEYGWIHFLLDANTIYLKDDVRIRPRFNDRSDWTVSHNVFYRPSRECFQVHGANHIFEYNEVIDHIGPWAGSAACCTITNDRNMKNYIVRYNYINGHAGNNKYHTEAFITTETNGRPQADENGDFTNGPTLFEYNLFANFTAGVSFMLGKGNVRMGDVTIRNNIFGYDLKGPVVLIYNPQKNLVVENNLFYCNNQILEVGNTKNGNPMEKPLLPSHITFRNNIFAGNKSLIDQKLFSVPQGSTITIDHNLFDNNGGQTMGSNALTMPIVFMDPDHFDFRIKSTNAEDIYKMKIGPYPDNHSIPEAAKWWEIHQRARKIITPGVQQ